MTSVPVTLAQAQLVRQAQAAVQQAQAQLHVIVSTLAAGYVPPGSALHGVTDDALHFTGGDDAA